MSLRLRSSDGGSVTLQEPTTATDYTLTLPAANGSLTPIISGTAVASTSGTNIDFTNIPSWVKRITIMVAGVSLSGTANLIVQLGTGGTPTTSGYQGTSSSALLASSVSTVNVSNGFVGNLGNAGYSLAGSFVFTNIDSNTWVCSGVFGLGGVVGTVTSSGRIALSGVLNMVRVTTTNGTDTFDAGTVNILYE